MIVPACVTAPELALPICKVPAVIFARLVTANEPAPPLMPIAVPAPLGMSETVPLPALMVPDVFRFTFAAVMEILPLFVEEIESPFGTLTTPVPAVLIVTPLKPTMFPPAILSDSLAEFSVSCRLPALELLGLRVTVLPPPLALSVMPILPLAVAVSAVALVFETRTAPVPPATVRLAVLRSPPVELTPPLPLRLMEVGATIPVDEKLIVPPVELRLMFAALKFEPAESVRLFVAVTFTCPVPACVAWTAAPKAMPPFVAVRLTVLTAIMVAPAF